MSWFLIALALTVLAAMVALYASKHMRQASLNDRLTRLALADGSGPEKWAQWRSAMNALAVPMAGEKERSRLRLNLSSAGFFRASAVNLFLLAKFGLASLALILGFIWLELDFSSLLSSPLNTFKYLGLVYLVARVPDWWLNGKIKERRAKIRAAIPQSIDLMTICVESGLSLEEALERVSREIARTAPEVSKEFSVTRSEMLVVNRWEALKRLEKRSGVREMGVLAGSLIQTMNYGTPLAEALRAIAADCRAARVSELEERAGSISAKVGIPLVLLILFPLVALIAAPAVITLIRTFS